MKCNSEGTKCCKKLVLQLLTALTSFCNSEQENHPPNLGWTNFQKQQQQQPDKFSLQTAYKQPIFCQNVSQHQVKGASAGTSFMSESATGLATTAVGNATALAHEPAEVRRLLIISKFSCRNYFPDCKCRPCPKSVQQATEARTEGTDCYSSRH